MVYIICTFCLRVCRCYFIHCRRFVCHGAECLAALFGRVDNILEDKQTHQQSIYLSLPAENGARRYILPSSLTDRRYALAREVFQDDETLVVQVYDARDPRPEDVRDASGFPLLSPIGVRPLARDWDLRRRIHWRITQEQGGMQMYEPYLEADEPLLGGDDLYSLVHPLTTTTANDSVHNVSMEE